jgi:formylglycine-generating enzyme required for sulfatase activity
MEVSGRVSSRRVWLTVFAAVLAALSALSAPAQEGGAALSGTSAPAQAEVVVPGVHWVRIPAGTFQMGCVPNDAACKADEKPRHSVTLTKPFDLMTTEVNLGMYQTYLSATGGALPEQPEWNSDGLQPIVNVTWDEASAFCRAGDARLPTESEWEYAARGGIDGKKYVWGDNDVPEVDGKPAANVADETAKLKSPGLMVLQGYDDGYPETAPVGSFPPNGYGLYDMTGNVWEWVADWSGSYPEGAVSDPHGPATGQDRVGRGGSWLNASPANLRVSVRFNVAPAGRFYFLGFRCARDGRP